MRRSSALRPCARSAPPEEQQRIGRSRELAATSALQLAGDPVTSLRTAVQAVDTADTTQATEALRQALAEAPLVYRTRVPTGARRRLRHLRPALAGRAFSDAHLYVLDARTGRRIGDLGDQTSVSWAPPEQSVGLGGDRRVRITANGVQLLDATGRQIARLPLGKGCTDGNAVAFTPDGRRLVTCIDGRVPGGLVGAHRRAPAPVARGLIGTRTSRSRSTTAASTTTSRPQDVHTDLRERPRAPRTGWPGTRGSTSSTPVRTD